jgi:hypothetical protein
MIISNIKRYDGRDNIKDYPKRWLKNLDNLRWHIGTFDLE